MFIGEDGGLNDHGDSKQKPFLASAAGPVLRLGWIHPDLLPLSADTLSKPSTFTPVHPFDMNDPKSWYVDRNNTCYF